MTSPAPAGWPPGLPEHVPGTTIDRQCGSAQQAIHFAAQAVMAGVKRRGRGRRRAADVDDPDQLGHDPRRRPRLHRSVHRLRGLGEALRRRRGQPVQQRRDDRREVGLLPRRHGGVRGGEPRAGHPGRGPRAASSGRSRRSTASPHDEGPREPNWEKIRSLQPLAEGGPGHRGRRLADLRRLGGAPHRQRAGPQGPRPHAAGPHPPHERPRRRPGVDAHRADPRHPPRASRRPA